MARDFAKSIQEAHFVSPNAPFTVDNSFNDCYQWFSLENHNPTILFPQILQANYILDIFIQSQLTKFDLDYKDLVLIGFSQGAMMAMYNSLRNKQQNCGIISYSGRLILPTMLGEKIMSKPKICLIHGKKDQVLPFSNFLEAKSLMEEIKIPFLAYSLEGLGHSIDSRGIRIGKAFLLNIKS